jgi:DNA-binding response OmpR family regulator
MERSMADDGLPHCRPRVLVVEDDALLAMHIADVLEQAGCMAIGPAMSAITALPAALRDHLDAAVLDISLIDQPVKPIADLLERRGIPFVFVTACPIDQLPAAHRSRPHVAKPFTDGDLAEVVTTLVSRKR